MAVMMGRINDTCTADARLVLLQAQVIAFRLRAPQTHPEHVLLSLLVRPDTLAGHVLSTLKVDRERACAAVEFIAKRFLASDGSQGKRLLQPPLFARETIGLLDVAAADVVHRGDGAIGTPHLLLALLQMQAGRVAILDAYGVKLEDAVGIVDNLRRTNESMVMTLRDEAEAAALRGQMPSGLRGSALWRELMRRGSIKLLHFARYYPAPFAAIIFWLIYAMTSQSQTDPGLTVNIDAIAAARVAIVACALQFIVPSWRQRLLYFLRCHRLAAGWLTMVAIRLALGITTIVVPGARYYYAVRFVQTLVLDVWMLIWISLLVRDLVRRNRRAAQRWRR